MYNTILKLNKFISSYVRQVWQNCKHNQIFCQCVTKNFSIVRASFKTKNTHPLRRYAFAFEGSNSIALFASATASAHQTFIEHYDMYQNKLIQITSKPFKSNLGICKENNIPKRRKATAISLNFKDLEYYSFQYYTSTYERGGLKNN